MTAPQLNLLFLAISVLASVASAAFFAAWVAGRAGREWVSTAAQIIALSTTWYCVSMSLTLFNRLMLGFTAFSFPITMSLSHMAIKGVLGISLALEMHRRTLAAQPGATKPTGSRWARIKALARSLIKSQKLTRRVFSRVLVPLGTTTALDVWLSAVSLQTLEISVYTTAKSCALIFTLVFSLVARLQALSFSVVGTVLMIGVGVILCSVKEVGVDPVGLVCVLLAAACGAARWVFTEQFYKRAGVKSNALVLIALLSPVTVLTLVPGLAWEVPRLVTHSPVHTSGDVGVVLAMTVGGGVLAFLLLIVELQLVGMTSALTLNVIGHAKDIVVIGLAVPILHEELTPINAAGVLLTLIATMMYSVQKSRSHAAATRAAADAGRASQILDENWSDPEPGVELAGGAAAAAAKTPSGGYNAVLTQTPATGHGGHAVPSGSPGDSESPSVLPARLRKGRRRGQGKTRYTGLPSGDGAVGGPGDESGSGEEGEGDDDGDGDSTAILHAGHADSSRSPLAVAGRRGLVLTDDALGPLIGPDTSAGTPSDGADGGGTTFAIVEEDDGEDEDDGRDGATSERGAAAAAPAASHFGQSNVVHGSTAVPASRLSATSDASDVGDVSAAVGDLEVTLDRRPHHAGDHVSAAQSELAIDGSESEHESDPVR